MRICKLGISCCFMFVLMGVGVMMFVVLWIVCVQVKIIKIGMFIILLGCVVQFGMLLCNVVLFEVEKVNVVGGFVGCQIEMVICDFKG